MRQLKITKQVTNRETASLDKYLQEIGKVELITADEEVDLAQRIRAGDRAALEKLIKANLRFVVSVSKQYCDRHSAIILRFGALVYSGGCGHHSDGPRPQPDRFHDAGPGSHHHPRQAVHPVERHDAMNRPSAFVGTSKRGHYPISGSSRASGRLHKDARGSG